MAPWYVWLTLLVGLVGSSGATWVVTLHSAQRAVDAERRARLEADAARRESALSALAAVCNLVTSQEAVWKDAESPVGQNARKSWHDLGVLYHCY
jgi:hypothetical protein